MNQDGKMLRAMIGKPVIRITEWDSGPEPGSLAFEMKIGTDRTFTAYVIRWADGTYKHMDAMFTDITGTIPALAASNREIAVASYIAQNGIR
jgi:hypothetical protein